MGPPSADSFKRPYVPSSSLARLSARQEQQQLELLEQAAEQQAAQRTAGQQGVEGCTDPQAAQPHATSPAAPEQLAPCDGDGGHASPKDVLSAGEHSRQSLTASFSSGSETPAHRPSLLRQASPVRSSALLEAQAPRRRSLQRPSFDG